MKNEIGISVTTTASAGAAPPPGRKSRQSRSSRGFVQIPNVEREARRVKKKRRHYIRTGHRVHATAGRIFSLFSPPQMFIATTLEPNPKHESTNRRRSVPWWVPMAPFTTRPL
jgi:hypothetical protein